MYTMGEISFENLSFVQKKDYTEVILYKMFSFLVPNFELSSLGEYSVKPNSLVFSTDCEKKLMLVLAKYIKDLKNKVTGNSTTYIHASSGIPLVGNISFGIVDRGSSLLEIKPITSCNLNCIYCSLSEGRKSRWHDFVVEVEYLIEEIKKVVEFKGIKDQEIHIGCQGEPLFYSELIKLVKGVSVIKNVSVISMDTNAAMLTKEITKELFDSGMNRFNISLNGVSQEMTDKMAGAKYPLKHVLKLCKYITKLGAELVIAPVWVPGINDKEIPDLIKLGKKLNAKMGIQNYLEYKHGKKPAKQATWDEFYAKLRDLEEKYNIKLKLDQTDFNIRSAPSLPKPFVDEEVVKARILCPGRYRNEAIVAAKNRNITVFTNKKSGVVKFKIIRTKHNIFLGK